MAAVEFGELSYRTAWEEIGVSLRCRERSGVLDFLAVLSKRIGWDKLAQASAGPRRAEWLVVGGELRGIRDKG